MAVASVTARSRVPAWLDLAQSVSGLILGLFMWAHMVFVSSILLSKDAMWAITRMFEGYFFFGRSYPLLVSGVVAAVWLTLVIHALLALRKFPADWQQYRSVIRHSRSMRHPDTTLWLWQVATGFALFFMAPIHLYQMLLHPADIGPYASSARVWSDSFWPLYLLMLFAVELHGGIGLYRLVIKWSDLRKPDPRTALRRLSLLKWSITVFLTALGLLTLAAYIRIGIAIEDQPGLRYTPSWIEQTTEPSP